MRVPPGVVAQIVPPGVALISRRSSLPGIAIRCDCAMREAKRGTTRSWRYVLSCVAGQLMIFFVILTWKKNKKRGAFAKMTSRKKPREPEDEDEIKALFPEARMRI